MSKPIWKKVTEIKPGIYLYGGPFNKPYSEPVSVIKKNLEYFGRAFWYARICDYVEPEMPLPDLAVDTRVEVRDDDGDEWQNRHFARFEDGKCVTWCNGRTSWTSHHRTNIRDVKWSQWRLPEGEK